MKRFYKTATVKAEADGHAVLLDGRPVKTPGKHGLVVPTAALAEAIADEWRAQGEKILPETMPLTKIANVVIDGVALRAEDIAVDVAAYAETDLICYLAEYPTDLVLRQVRGWQPWIDWAAERYDARLVTTAGIVHRPQPAEAVAALRAAVTAFDPWTLAALHILTTAGGSLVLALAVVENELAAETAFDLSEIDECFQRERWGEDAEATTARARVRADMAVTGRFLALLR